MEANKLKKKSILGKSLIFLLIIFAVVIAYVVVLYPRFSLKLSTLDGEYLLAQTQINGLQPYETKLGELGATEAKYNKEYEKDTSLRLPIELSDIIYKAADTAHFTVRNMSVDEGTELATKEGFTTQCHTATVTLDLLEGYSVPGFVKQLEAYEGAGLYVTGIEYIYPEEGKTGLMTATIAMYTVAK